MTNILQESITKTKNIANLISDNTAFRNPYSSTLPVLNLTIDNALDVVESSPIGTELYTNAVAITNALNTLKSTVNDFTSHTNNISGVGLSLGLNNADFGTISQVMATIDRYKDDGSACELIYSAFGALLKVAEITQAIQVLINQLQNITDFPNQIVGYIDLLKTILASQIENDLIAFTNARLRALQLAVSQALTSITNNPCLSDIISIIGTEELRQIIRPQISEIL